MEEYVKALKGITYPEWTKLRIAVERSFEYQRSESEKELKLTDTDTVTTLIQSQFGRTSG